MNNILRKVFSIDQIRNFIHKNVIYIFIIAIILRLLTSFFYGTQDVEWWKAWYSSIDKKGITNIYGAEDSINLKLINQGLTFDKIREKTQNVIEFEPYKYGRRAYVVTQPPFYLYHLFIAGKIYKKIDPNLTNNRLYNFFLNIFPMLYSILTSILIFYFLKSTKYDHLALISALFYLLNPLIILNSPIQGFWDPILAFYVLLSLVFLYKNKPTLSVVSLTLAILIKPTAIIVLPVYIYIILKETPLLKIIKSIVIAIIIGLILISPYIYYNHFISMCLGVQSILNSSNDISRQSLNIWWPVQYFFNYYTSNSHETIDLLLGKNFIWFEDFPVSKFSKINFKVLSLLLFCVATIINLINTSKLLAKNRLYIFYFAFIQCYIYFMLRIGVQNNHYYIMIIIFSIFCFVSEELFYTFLSIILLFLLQDFIFYGFGRDFNIMLRLLTFFHLPIITVILSILNFILFVRILKKPLKI